MDKLLINTARTENGYSGSCDLLPGWIVASEGNFETFQKEVQESIDFYVACAKEDHESYPAVLDGYYDLVFKFDVQSLLQFFQGVFSFSALQTITGINQKQLAHYAAGRSKPRPQQAKKIADGLHRLAQEMMAVTV